MLKHLCRISRALIADCEATIRAEEHTIRPAEFTSPKFLRRLPSGPPRSHSLRGAAPTQYGRDVVMKPKPAEMTLNVLHRAP